MKFKTGVLTARILGIILLSIFISTVLIGIFIYAVNKVYLERGLRQSLEKLAATSSLMIDGEIHKRITSDESPEYLVIQSVLRKIKDINELDAPVYTLKRSFEKNKVACVVTSDEASLLGARYNLNNEMSRAFKKGVVTCTNFYTDKTGTWVSAFAPIRDRDDHIVGLLKVQHHAGFIFEELRSRLFMLIIFCAMGFIISSLITIPLATSMTNSIKKLDVAAKDLEVGNYDRKIDIRSNDEIGHLSKTFEEMRIRLRDNMLKLQEAWVKEKKAHLESILTLSLHKRTCRKSNRIQYAHRQKNGVVKQTN
jgi:methyl-accepting chemotaxis protein